MSVGAIGSGYSQTSSLYSTQSTEDRPPTIEEMLTELDADGSGDLSLEETGLSDEQFSSLDVDGDGVLTQADHEALLSQMQSLFGGGQAPPPPPMDLSELDADEDGAISEEESGLSSDEFSALDADGDGVLTEADFEAMMAQMESDTIDGLSAPPEPKSAEEVVSELDSDEDGQLSQSEMGMSDEQFDELDTNQDGYVSQAELEAAHQSMGSAGDGGGFMNNYAMSAYQSQNTMFSALSSLGQGFSASA